MTQSAYKAPSPEDVEVGKAYAFTLSPIDNLQFFNANIIHRVNQFKNGTKEVLDSLFNPTDIRVKLRMELSKQSRLHYHGWITFSSDEDIRYFYLIMIRKLKNKFTYDIHPISDYKEDGKRFSDKYPTWKAYVNKQGLWNVWYKIHYNHTMIKL